MVKMNQYKTREDWLQARTSCIGGSDASCILGLNKWKTNVRLFEEKTCKVKAEDISNKDVVQYGIFAENPLRELFKLDFPKYRVEYVENNMWTNDKFPFAHASLDGWIYDENNRFGVFENKTSTIQSASQKAEWDGKIPDAYYCQILHYFMVTEADFAVLKAQLKHEWSDDLYIATKHYHIERSECEEDIKTLIEAEKQFSECIKNNIAPSLILPQI